MTKVRELFGVDKLPPLFMNTIDNTIHLDQPPELLSLDKVLSLERPAHLKYVITVRGELLITTPNRIINVKDFSMEPIPIPIKTYHSEIAQKKPIVLGGDFFVDPDGSIEMNNSTGHYLCEGMEKNKDIATIAQHVAKRHGYSRVTFESHSDFNDHKRKPQKIPQSVRPDDTAFAGKANSSTDLPNTREYHVLNGNEGLGGKPTLDMPRPTANARSEPRAGKSSPHKYQPVDSAFPATEPSVDVGQPTDSVASSSTSQAHASGASKATWKSTMRPLKPDRASFLMKDEESTQFLSDLFKDPDAQHFMDAFGVITEVTTDGVRFRDRVARIEDVALTKLKPVQTHYSWAQINEYGKKIEGDASQLLDPPFGQSQPKNSSTPSKVIHGLMTIMHLYLAGTHIHMAAEREPDKDPGRWVARGLLDYSVKLMLGKAFCGTFFLPAEILASLPDTSALEKNLQIALHEDYRGVAGFMEVSELFDRHAQHATASFTKYVAHVALAPTTYLYEKAATPFLDRVFAQYDRLTNKLQGTWLDHQDRTDTLLQQLESNTYTGLAGLMQWSDDLERLSQQSLTLPYLAVAAAASVVAKGAQDAVKDTKNAVSENYGALTAKMKGSVLDTQDRTDELSWQVAKEPDMSVSAHMELGDNLEKLAAQGTANAMQATIQLAAACGGMLVEAVAVSFTGEPLTEKDDIPASKDNLAPKLDEETVVERPDNPPFTVDDFENTTNSTMPEENETPKDNSETSELAPKTTVQWPIRDVAVALSRPFALKPTPTFFEALEAKFPALKNMDLQVGQTRDGWMAVASYKVGQKLIDKFGLSAELVASGIVFGGIVYGVGRIEERRKKHIQRGIERRCQNIESDIHAVTDAQGHYNSLLNQYQTATPLERMALYPRIVRAGEDVEVAFKNARDINEPKLDKSHREIMQNKADNRSSDRDTIIKHNVTARALHGILRGQANFCMDNKRILSELKKDFSNNSFLIKMEECRACLMAPTFDAVKAKDLFADLEHFKSVPEYRLDVYYVQSGFDYRQWADSQQDVMTTDSPSCESVQTAPQVDVPSTPTNPIAEIITAQMVQAIHQLAANGLAQHSVEIGDAEESWLWWPEFYKGTQQVTTLMDYAPWLMMAKEEQHSAKLQCVMSVIIKHFGADPAADGATLAWFAQQFPEECAPLYATYIENLHSLRDQVIQAVVADGKQLYQAEMDYYTKLDEVATDPTFLQDMLVQTTAEAALDPTDPLKQLRNQQVAMYVFLAQGDASAAATLLNGIDPKQANIVYENTMLLALSQGKATFYQNVLHGCPDVAKKCTKEVMLKRLLALEQGQSVHIKSIHKFLNEHLQHPMVQRACIAVMTKHVRRQAVRKQVDALLLRILLSERGLGQLFEHSTLTEQLHQVMVNLPTLEPLLANSLNGLYAGFTPTAEAERQFFEGAFGKSNSLQKIGAILSFANGLGLSTKLRRLGLPPGVMDLLGVLLNSGGRLQGLQQQFMPTGISLIREIPRHLGMAHTRRTNRQIESLFYHLSQSQIINLGGSGIALFQIFSHFKGLDYVRVIAMLSAILALGYYEVYGNSIEAELANIRLEATIQPEQDNIERLMNRLDTIRVTTAVQAAFLKETEIFVAFQGKNYQVVLNLTGDKKACTPMMLLYRAKAFIYLASSNPDYAVQVEDSLKTVEDNHPEKYNSEIERVRAELEIAQGFENAAEQRLRGIPKQEFEQAMVETPWQLLSEVASKRVSCGVLNFFNSGKKPVPTKRSAAENPLHSPPAGADGRPRVKGKPKIKPYWAIAKKLWDTDQKQAFLDQHILMTAIKWIHHRQGNGSTKDLSEALSSFLALRYSKSSGEIALYLLAHASICRELKGWLLAESQYIQGKYGEDLSKLAFYQLEGLLQAFLSGQKSIEGAVEVLNLDGRYRAHVKQLMQVELKTLSTIPTVPNLLEWYEQGLVALILSFSGEQFAQRYIDLAEQREVGLDLLRCVMSILYPEEPMLQNQPQRQNVRDLLWQYAIYQWPLGHQVRLLQQLRSLHPQDLKDMQTNDQFLFDELTRLIHTVGHNEDNSQKLKHYILALSPDDDRNSSYAFIEKLLINGALPNQISREETFTCLGEKVSKPFPFRYLVHELVTKGRDDLIGLFVRFGADFTKQDFFGMTPRDLYLVACQSKTFKRNPAFLEALSMALNGREELCKLSRDEWLKTVHKNTGVWFANDRCSQLSTTEAREEYATASWGLVTADYVGYDAESLAECAGIELKPLAPFKYPVPSCSALFDDVSADSELLKMQDPESCRQKLEGLRNKFLQQFETQWPSQSPPSTSSQPSAQGVFSHQSSNREAAAADDGNEQTQEAAVFG